MTHRKRHRAISHANNSSSVRDHSGRPKGHKPRSVFFSHKAKERLKAQKTEIVIPSERVNDNIYGQSASGSSLGQVMFWSATGLLMLAIFIQMNLGVIAYEIMLHANEKVLTFLMKTSPNMVAYSLNHISPE